LWTALLLQAFGVAWPPAVVCLTTAAGAVIITRADLPDGSAVLPSVCVAAAVCLAACVVALLGRPSPHA
ncbi:hypothetical protein ACFUGD_25520, partial [Streptomyces sp. NPDC057217]